jgi:hypothetical protein
LFWVWLSNKKNQPKRRVARPLQSSGELPADL